MPKQRPSWAKCNEWAWPLPKPKGYASSWTNEYARYGSNYAVGEDGWKIITIKGNDQWCYTFDNYWHAYAFALYMREKYGD